MTLKDCCTNINDSNYIFFFLVVDDFLSFDPYPQLTNFQLIFAYHNHLQSQLTAHQIASFCLEDQGIFLPQKNSGNLLAQPTTINYIQTTAKKINKQVAIIPFKPSAKIEKLCQKYNWTLVANPAHINRFFEDKIKFLDICTANKLPHIPSFIDKFNHRNFTKYQHQFHQDHLVIQTHFGWAGQSTHHALNYQDMADSVPQNSLVKFSPFLSGYTLTNNCCLTSHGLIHSPSALQFTGITSLTTNPFSTVGRQWPSYAPVEVNHQIDIITTNFSSILKSHSYQGFFGLDFFVDHQNKVYLLECNPRLTASFAFYTSLELKNNLIPLFYFHLLEFTSIPYSVDITTEAKRNHLDSIVGSEITPKDSQGNTINKFHYHHAISSDPWATDLLLPLNHG